MIEDAILIERRMKMQHSYKNDKSNSGMRFFALLLAVLILSFVVVSSSLVSDHNCAGENCAICLFTSRISASFSELVFVAILAPVVIYFFTKKTSDAKQDTLITLKNKISS